MRYTRRNILRKASILPALTLGSSGIASAVDCSGIQQWDPEIAYNGGTMVVYDDTLWKAEWWTRGSEPAESKSVWTKTGDCGSSGGDGEELSAVINVSDTTVRVGTEVTFDSSGSTGDVQSYEWEIDSQTKSGESVTHTFDAIGDYTVTLTVTNSAEASAMSATTVNVQVDTGGDGGTGSTVFAPYDHMTTRPGTTLVEHSQQAGNDAVTASSRMVTETLPGTAQPTCTSARPDWLRRSRPTRILAVPSSSRSAARSGR